MRAMVILLAGCSTSGMLLSSVRPHNSGASCPSELFVGETLTRSLWWECDLAQHGREGGHHEGKCQTALEATVRCEGVECESKVEIEKRDGYAGARTMTIELATAGDLRLWVDLVHKGGFKESYIAADCEVLPRPSISIGCEVRDPMSGAFAMCPEVIPLGWEVHLAASVGYTSGSGPGPRVLFDDKELADRACRTPESKDEHVKTVRCVTTPTVGTHRVTAKIKDKFEQSIDLEVGPGAPPGAR